MHELRHLVERFDLSQEVRRGLIKEAPPHRRPLPELVATLSEEALRQIAAELKDADRMGPDLAVHLALVHAERGRFRRYRQPQ